MADMATSLSPVLVDEMRGWLADCEWADADFLCMATAQERVAFFGEFPAATIARVVEREFDGGVEAFIMATGRYVAVSRDLGALISKRES